MGITVILVVGIHAAEPSLTGGGGGGGGPTQSFQHPSPDPNPIRSNGPGLFMAGRMDRATVKAAMAIATMDMQTIEMSSNVIGPVPPQQVLTRESNRACDSNGPGVPLKQLQHAGAE